MKFYFIYRIDENGAPKMKMAAHALNIDAMWASSRGGFSNGLYLVTNSDGSEAKIFEIRRI